MVSLIGDLVLGVVGQQIVGHVLDGVLGLVLLLRQGREGL